MNVDQCMQQYGSDKSPALGVHAYTVVYEQLFNEKRYEVKSLFEIGIGYRFYKESWMKDNEQYVTGASLRGWQDYFPNASIYGCDIEEKILFQDERIKTFLMDQSKYKQFTIVKDNVPPESLPFDIIIDDGSHSVRDQFLSAIRLLPLVRNGGMYIIEDVKRRNLYMFNSKCAPRYARVSNVDFSEVTTVLNSVDKIDKMIDFGPFKDKNNEGLIIIHKK